MEGERAVGCGMVIGTLPLGGEGEGMSGAGSYMATKRWSGQGPRGDLKDKIVMFQLLFSARKSVL